ncbi:transporter [Plakobranchus ocellatus]|uniref:Transporter n=1 Tax=Plakobranchus ocellatus TaxID=259542 RepID=A0AAV4CF74_9GAST|nr:transporter [Plakobranchus ocellatus]
MFIISCLIAIYYNMIIAWTLYYFFASFNTYLPWSYCGDWSSEACLADTSVMHNCTAHNGTWYNATCFLPGSYNQSYLNLINDLSNSSNINYTSSSDEYFHKVVLDITPGIDSIGHIKWELALCLLLAWIIVGVCLAKGIKSSGKVWKDAAVQIFFSLSPGWGGLITLASYNKFHNNCYFDAIVVSILDCLTSVFAGLVIFSIIGYMAEELHQSVDKVASDGPGLAFVVYPAAVAKLPVSQLWAVLFFAMLITLGLGTQIATVTTVHTTLIDRFSNLIKPGRRSFLLLVAIACVGYLCGLPFCTQGGMYVVQLFDNYAATYSLLATGLAECVALAWVYGCDRFLSDIETMLGKRPHQIWTYSWRFIAPISLFVILIFTLVHPDRTSYEDYMFPIWADGIGVLISLMSILAIPGVAIYMIVSAMCSDSTCGLQKTVQKLSHPTAEWGPRKKEHRMLVKGNNYGDDPVAVVTHKSQQAMMLNDFK